MRGVIIVVIVVAFLIGGIMTLRSTRGAGMPDKDVIDRARQREREQKDKDKDEET